jgi:hypothetical protein
MTTPQDYLYRAAKNSYDAFEKAEEIYRALEITEHPNEEITSKVLDRMEKEIEFICLKLDKIMSLLKKDSDSE